MNTKVKFARHYEEYMIISASPENLFTYADNPKNFSSHMNKSSWMMGGGKMETKTDADKGEKVGSHIKMTGNVFGFNLFLDEVVTIHESPFHKEWQTVGKINLIVIDHYRLGFEIKPEKKGSRVTVYIDYDLPNSSITYILGILFGEMYAKWCVRQMLNGIEKHFNDAKKNNF